MKAITTLSLFLVMLMGSLSAQQVHLVPSATDSTRMDTIVVSEMVDDEAAAYDDEEATTHSYSVTSSVDSNHNGFGTFKNMALIPIVAIIFTFGFPIVLVGLVLWFKYKNRQAKYKLMSQALEAGQTLPADFMAQLNKASHDDLYESSNRLKNKGIQNLFLGLGLGLFLWFLTNTTAIAAIGLFLFCIGAGQIVMAYTDFDKKKNRNKGNTTSTPNDTQQPTGQA